MKPATSDEVFEHDGLLWKRRPGAQSTFAKLAAARSFFLETNEAARWNPRLRGDRAAELDAAMAVLQEWTRAEPDFRQWTEQETQQRLDEGDRARAAARAEEEARWERDKALFNADLFAEVDVAAAEEVVTFRSRRWVRPEDLNAHGTLFGGSLLRWIDEEAAIYAILQIGNPRAVTKFMSEIDFVSSAVRGDLIELGIRATHFGRTSITMRAEVRNMVTRARILRIELQRAESSRSSA